MIEKTAPTNTFRIWIAGDYYTAIQACRQFTLKGLCVAVQSTDFVYTMGAESGVCVTIINYPRFPRAKNEIEKTAFRLGEFLCDALVQGSYTIEGPDQMWWVSRRDQSVDEGRF